MKTILALLIILVSIIVGAIGGVAIFLQFFPMSDVMARTKSFEPENQTALYRGMSEYFPTRIVARGGPYSPLPEDTSALESFEFIYNGKTLTISDVIRETELSGLVIISDGKLLYESYADGADSGTQFTSWSVVKSITSTLVGFAVGDGLIASVEDRLETYLPELVGTAYEGVTIRQALEMSSGVRFDPDGPAGKDTVDWITKSAVIGRMTAFEGAISYPRAKEPGTVFNYNTAESQVLIELVRRVTGKDAADYLSEKVWKPLGMSHDAVWVLDRAGPSGAEYGGAFFNGTLRDWGRFGMLMAQDGVWNDERLLPEGWVRAATQSDLPHLQPGVVYEGFERGYAWHWWTLPNGTFTASGANGQAIFVNPQERLVVVRAGSWPSGWVAEYHDLIQAMHAALATWLTQAESGPETP